MSESEVGMISGQNTSTEWLVVTRKKSKNKKDQRMTHERATNYQRSLNIKNLAKILMSVEARNLEEDGWRFYKVLRGGQAEDMLPTKDRMEYIHIPIPNEWQDRAYYCRVDEVAQQTYEELTAENDAEYRMAKLRGEDGY